MRITVEVVVVEVDVTCDVCKSKCAEQVEVAPSTCLLLGRSRSCRLSW